jgi:hypothetical protein
LTARLNVESSKGWSCHKVVPQTLPRAVRSPLAKDDSEETFPSRPKTTRDTDSQVLFGTAMKFTLSWLKDHLETDAPLEEIVATLTKIGLEVEHVDDRAQALKGFVIAGIVEAKPHPHPNADRLRLCFLSTREKARRCRSFAERPCHRASLCHGSK